MRLAERLQSQFPGASRRRVKQWLEASRVRVDGAIVRHGSVSVADDARVELTAPPPLECPPPLRLVYEDADLLVVDKPAGLLTIATERERERTAYRLLGDWLAARGSSAGRLLIVHRLDRETSGLVVFAKSSAAKQSLQAQFATRGVERIYAALVEGIVQRDQGTLTGRIVEDRSLRVRTTLDRRAGRDAITRYRVLERRREVTLLELSLVTGRRGQIRAQLAALGHPILGDSEFGSRRNPLRRVALHATRLGFVHPAGGRSSFESAMPAEFTRASREKPPPR
jgi:23S rRNA pseudouridine1911/1915/1917 synthase